MARTVLFRMIDTFRSLRPSQGNWFVNPFPFRDSCSSQFVLNTRNVRYSDYHPNFSTLASSQTVGLGPSTSCLQVTNDLQITTIRTNVRCHFPRPSEYKRIKRHGWKTRMSTQSGRKIIMRRILQGRHVLTH